MALAANPAPLQHHNSAGSSTLHVFTPMVNAVATVETSYLSARPERSSSKSSTKLPRALPPIPSDPPAGRMTAPSRPAPPLSYSPSPRVHKPFILHHSPNKRGLISLVLQARALSTLLSFLPWTDFLALAQSCRSAMKIMHKRDLKDVVLARYVEGYGICLRMQNASRDVTQEVPVSLHDVDLLLISQHTPLHLYPTRALATLSSLLPQTGDSASQKLVQLTQAHSRFVLLLQSLAHSSSLPPPLEPEPETDPLVDDTVQGPALSTTSPRSRSSISSGSVRELTFPAPLFRPKVESDGDVPPPVPDKPSTTSTRGVARLARSPTKAVTAPSAFPNASIKHANTLHSTRSPPATVHGRSPSTNSLSMLKKKSRMSVFGGSPTALPPPSDPKDLMVHSKSWRRSLINASVSHSKRPSVSAHGLSASEGWTSDDEQGFLPPRRRFASTNFDASDSSLASSGSPSPGTSSPPFTRSERRSSPSPPPSALSSLGSPHDLMLATSRVRAPVLRVYVPCSDLSETPEFLFPEYVQAMGGTSSIQQCEEQLANSGLWQHLSIGDIVCNLGYVPPAVGTSGGEDSASEDVPGVSRESSQVRSPRGRSGKESRTWLIFNGSFLVPFCPPDDKLPIEDAITLPSPFYYDHIMPSRFDSMGSGKRSSFSSVSPIRAGNLRFSLGRLPPPSRRGDEAPRMQLVSSVTNVRSPHSPGGVACVKIWVWTARVWRGGVALNHAGAFAGSAPAASTMGIGWEGEWVLEGDGTVEGRQFLIDCLNGTVRGTRDWEFVRDRSGGGRIWLKLLDFPSRSESRPSLQDYQHNSY